jgi:MFS family permease
MNKKERRASFSLASIYAFRMLGLFMIYPIFSLYAQQLPDATPFLIGLALGIYGLAQAVLQIPFGMLSDRIGRKAIITFGLILFALGSLLAAHAHTLTGIIWGRVFQGAGAIGSSLTALVADSTRDEHRLKAMSIVGMTIGLSFTLAIIVGPILNTWIGVPGIFALTAVLAVIAIVVLWFVVPTPKQIRHHRDSQPSGKKFLHALKNRELLRLDSGIFLLHATLTATFIAIPLALYHVAHMPINHQWIIYLPAMILSFVAMVPFIIIAETRQKMKAVFVSAIAALALSQGLLWLFHASAIVIAFLLFLYFTAFILLEASLPSLVSKIAPLANKGTALGIYSSAQFLGIFFGGVLGGLIYHHFSFDGLFGFNLILALIWLVIAITMKTPRALSTKIFHINPETDVQAVHQIKNKIAGIIEIVVDQNEHVVYLKVDKRLLDEDQLVKFFK